MKIAERNHDKSCQFVWFLDPKYVFVDVLIALQMLER